MGLSWDIFSAFGDDPTVQVVPNSGVGWRSLVPGGSSPPPARADDTTLSAVTLSQQSLLDPKTGERIMADVRSGKLTNAQAQVLLADWASFQKAQHPTVMSNGDILVSGKVVGSVADSMPGSDSAYFAPAAIPVAKVVKQATPNMPDPAPSQATTSPKGFDTSQVLTQVGNILTSAATQAGTIYKAQVDAKAAADIAKFQAQAQVKQAKLAAAQGKPTPAAPEPRAQGAPLLVSPNAGGGLLASLGLTKADQYQNLIRTTAIVVLLIVGGMVVLRMVRGGGEDRHA